jgi:hypothetical protein
MPFQFCSHICIVSQRSISVLLINISASAIAQAARRWCLTLETQVQPWVTSNDIHDG